MGAAIFRHLVDAGCSTLLIERDIVGGGTTAAGMGHIAIMDDSPAQMHLCKRSQELWHQLIEEIGADAEAMHGGSTWIAEDDQEWQECLRKQQLYSDWSVPNQLWDQKELRLREPDLAHDLLGAFHLPADHVVYQPRCARWLVDQTLDAGGVIRKGSVFRIESGAVTLDNGEQIQADHVVIATGAQTNLLPDWLSIRPRKGHLMITPKGMPLCTSQLIELGYLKSAHGHSDTSVAFNLQPRPHGQNLLGSSRQFKDTSTACSAEILHQMVARATRYIPRIADVPMIRAWTGFRPCTHDHLPVVGVDPFDKTLHWAVGHEGLGITTSLATAELITHEIMGTTPPIDASPYLPNRMVDHAA